MTVKKEALNRAIKLLEAAGAEYHIRYESEEYGSPINNKSARYHKNPGVTDYVRAHLPEMLQGDVTTIPLGPYPVNSLQGCICALLSSRYGAGKCITSRTKDGIEVLRVE